jgi:hypothetical protein
MPNTNHGYDRCKERVLMQIKGSLFLSWLHVVASVSCGKDNAYLHCEIVWKGLSFGAVIGTAFPDMDSKCEGFEEAQIALDAMRSRNRTSGGVLRSSCMPKRLISCHLGSTWKVHPIAFSLCLTRGISKCRCMLQDAHTIDGQEQHLNVWKVPQKGPDWNWQSCACMNEFVVGG